MILNSVELELAVLAGTARYEQNKINKMKGDHGIELDVRGMAGEIAVCKYFGVYPDLKIGPNRLGHDLEHKGLKIDVKCTKYRQGWLRLGLNQKAEYNLIYLLVTEIGKEYHLVGWQWSETILQDQYRTEKGYIMEQSMLRDIDEITK